MAISPDGRWGLSGSEDKTLRLWDLATGACLRAFEQYAGSVSSVAISADGRWGLSGSHERGLRLWDLATGECLRTFVGQTKYVNSVAISPDGRWGLSGSGWVGRNNTLRLWDLTTGKCLRLFEGRPWPVRSVAISPNARRVLSGYQDGTVCLWELVWDYECPESTDWDEGARPYLEIFLTRQCPYGDDGISRAGRPRVTKEAFNQLLRDLQLRGYGWLRPKGVYQKLKEMVANWTGPPPLLL